MTIDAPLPPWWMELFGLGDGADFDRLEDRIVAAGDGGLRAVCAVLDPAFGERPVPRPTEQSREFCAHVLVRFARPELAPWMFEMLERGRGEDPTAPGLAGALAACGSVAARAAVDRFAQTEPGDPLRPWLAEVVSGGGDRGEESLAVLVTYLADDPVHVTGLLTDYGDPAAVPALVAEFDRTTADGPDGDPQMLSLLGSAVLSLGGELGPERMTRFDASRDESRRLATAQRRSMIDRGGFGGPVPRPEPDDDCPCESGARYDGCCAAIEADLAERFRLRRNVPRRY